MDPLRHNIPRDRDDGGHDINQDILSRTQQDDMVSAPAAPPPSNPTSRDANVAKRYRAAPAKTFQCRGYGDCHMVFSRSEHLARHVRKHTGERPFTCHCGKQFSRLDNLRQHAQTVHSDKPEDNERMMRELTALHTSMAAAHKAATSRGKRSQQSLATPASAAANASQAASLGMGSSSVNNGVKVEEMQMHRTLSSANYYGQQRPGTSVGYDVGPDSSGSAPSFGHRASWQQLDHAANANAPPSSTHSGARPYHAQEQLQLQSGQHIQQQQRVPSSAYAAHHPADGHSFRDSHQSFRNSQPSAQFQHQQQQLQQPGQSFLASQPFLPSPAELASGRPSSSRSRPPTSSGPDPGTAAAISTSSAPAVPAASNVRTPLPPISAVIPQSIAAPGRQPAVLQLPPSSAGTDARRPGTAPATYAYLPHRSSFGSGRSAARGPPGGGLGAVPELSVYGATTTTELGGPAAAAPGPAYEFARSQREYAHAATYGYPPSPPDGYGSGANDSPFSFHPPSLADSGPSAAAPATSRLRKRPYSGDDGSESDDDIDSDVDVRDDATTGGGSAARPPPTPSTAAGERGEYDYGGTGSRPQSRRLSVMELCNDADAAGSAFLPLSGSSRPATASGRVEFASPSAAAALAESAAAAAIPTGSAAPTAAALPTATTTASTAAAGGGSSPGGSPVGSPFAYGLDGPGGGLHTAVRRYGAGGGAAAGVLPRRSSPGQRQQQQRASASPRSPSTLSFGRRSPASGSGSGGSASPSYAHVGAHAGDGLQQSSRHDQVRVSVSPRGSTATPTGVRV
ncbi:uncharacterized protein FOMMEDRAFT_153579 [Fomitiporia mediterranea MF3/22]|uniref:uncharacterized protein n=1 Tax=Fomitiporia mediterranea (strain MF3/22) TaxID=694068 RepID=UPI000440938B|nr:uncharacterized protein FOMMEDRAFT_153579 [Fomitiporia mediterranea MF3/22]EJD06179.1 hypothetical protein FOMMEDRAFT_153579 [Fomitiporia mediterranea MF3/22]